MKHNVGAPPGEIFYTGPATNDRVTLTLIQYNETEFYEQDFLDLSECLAELKPGLVKWININGIHKTELIEAIGKKFNIHPLTLEDIVHVESRPKFEDYDNYVVSILQMLYFDKDNVIQNEHLSIILQEEFVISFQEPKGGDAFDFIRNRLRQGKGRIRKMPADYLSYALIDAVVDCYFQVLAKLGEQIESLDEEMINGGSQRTILKIYDVKRQIINLRKTMVPVKELIANMVRSDTELIREGNDFYLRDVQDHINRVVETIDSYRESISGIMELYHSNTSLKTNEAMKALTVISSVFIPVTFVAGVYGMNFDNMPELRTENGYFVSLIIMAVMMLAMFWYMKKRKWI